MRYQARWSNGFWKTFDAAQYRDTGIHATKKEASAEVDRLNRGR